MSSPLAPPGADATVANPATGMSYRLGRQIGAGAFGVAHECEDRFGEHLVAKIIKPRGVTSSELRAEWEREVQLMQLLRHPYVVHITDAFEHDGRYYLIMERADYSLHELVDHRGGLTADEVIETGRQLLSALHSIHLRQVVHRDLHVDNILMGRAYGRYVVKVTDFGISKLVDEEESRKAYTDVGRSYYVAPELVRFQYTTIQSDIYQLGLVLYHAYTGSPAITVADGEVSQAILSGVARQRAEAIGDPVGQWISVMLRRREEYRFHSALDAWLAWKSPQPNPSPG